MKQFLSKKHLLLKVLSVILVAVGIVLLFFYRDEITVENILKLIPDNKLAAIVFIWAMFFIKSLSVLFPVSIIYIVTGLLFSASIAVIINIVGIIITFTYSYWRGHNSGKDLQEKLMIKYPKLKQIDYLIKNNEWFITFISRIVGMLPMDVVSIFMGSIGISYKTYLTASILGTLPILLSTTFIGNTIINPKSRKFILSILFRVVISIASIFTYRKTIKKKL